MKRSLRTMWKYVRRTPFHAFAAIFVLSITCFLVTVFALVSVGGEVIIRHFESRPQVTAFFKDNTTDADIANLQTSLNKISGISSTEFISKTHALEIYKAQNKNDPLLLQMVTADILPSSIEVRADNPVVLSQVADIMKQNTIVEEVVYQKDIVNNLIQWTRAIRTGGLALVLFLVSSSILMVMIIISMKIASHKTEIEIIELLGGSKGHIAMPFLLEALFYGTVGGIAGWGLAYIALLYSTPFILSFIGNIPLLPVPVPLMLVLLAGQIALGMCIGLFSSIFSVRRFLK